MIQIAQAVYIDKERLSLPSETYHSEVILSYYQDRAVSCLTDVRIHSC